MPPSEDREPITVVIERFVAGGEGLAHHPDGRVVFVRGGIPGDRAEIRIVDERRDWLRADLLSVESPSPDRIVPSCVHRLNGCGGCDWAEVEDGAQRAHKAAIVAEALRRTARIELTPDIGQSVSRTGYRTSIRVVGADDGSPAYRRSGSTELVAARGCEVAEARLRSVLDQIALTPGLEVGLRTSVATGAVSARWDDRSGSVDGLPPDAVIGSEARIVERVSGKDLAVSTGSFFQSGPEAAEILVASIAELAPEIGSCAHLLDAYAGVGLFAATLGAQAQQLTVVESSRAAVADARVNLAARGSEVSFARCDVGDWRPAGQRTPVDVVIADPARTGLGRPGVGAVTRARPELLILVSCDPVAMARDTALLGAAGYHLESAVVHDLFPGTHHVEVVSRFVPAGTLGP